MFGISPLGWVHTLGSLPAIPAAAYMFIRHGRIRPDTTAGRVYLVTMTIGAVSAFPVAKEPVSYVIATLTLLALLVGYGVRRLGLLGRATAYVETFALSFSALLLMIPTVTETLTRVPDGNPWASGVSDPLVVGAQGFVALVFVLGVIAQFIALARGRMTA